MSASEDTVKELVIEVLVELKGENARTLPLDTPLSDHFVAKFITRLEERLQIDISADAESECRTIGTAIDVVGKEYAESH